MSASAKNLEGLTPEEKKKLLARLLAQRQEAQQQKAQPVEPESFELSFAQQRLWFLDQLEPGGATYNNYIAVEARGALRPAALHRAFGEVVTRHEALRTRFSMVGGKPVQLVEPSLHVPMPLVDLSGVKTKSPGRAQAEVERLAAAASRRGFDLTRLPLLRHTLLRLGREEHVLLLCLHHIVSDGWSMGVLIRELGALYDAFVRGVGSPLRPLPIQYVDFAQWQRDHLEGGVLDRQLEYWRRQLAGVPVLELPTDRPRPPVQTLRGKTFIGELWPGDRDALLALGREAGASLFMVGLAVFQVLLARTSGQRDVAVGAPVANRDRLELEGLIGLLINTLVLRTDLSGQPSFVELLERVRQVCVGAYGNQDLPFELLVDRLGVARDMSHPALAQVVFRQEYHQPDEQTLEGLVLQPVMADNDTAKFDLTLVLGESAQGFYVTLEYNSDLYEDATARRLVAQYETLLTAVCEHPREPVWRLDMLPAAERRQLLAWNPIRADLAGSVGLEPEPEQVERLEAERLRAELARAELNGAGPALATRLRRTLPRAPLHRLFEQRAREAPDAPAVTFRDAILSYGELDDRANRLAHRLRRLGVAPETPVALLLERGSEMVVAILAVLKAGGAYVPLDPAYPPRRLAFVVRDSGAALVITERALAGLLEPESGGDGAEASVSHHRTLVLDAPPADGSAAGDEGLAAAPEATAAPAVGVDALAYVIYTSGSTGEPKGVLIPHSHPVDLFAATEPWFRPGPEDVWTLFHSFAFDFSVWELWGALLYGGRLVIVPYEVSRSPEAFHRLLRDQRVSVLSQTPSAFHALARADAELAGSRAEDSAAPWALRTVVFGGEALEARALGPWIRRHGDEAPWLINMYGITETTVHVTYRRLSRSDAEAELDPGIGEAIPDQSLRILEPGGDLAPIGVPGELCVGGGRLARGYLGRPALTARRFVPDPFATIPGARLYRSGDRARYRGDGSVEYLGRIDQQIKLRGFRIEAGEVEAALLEHPAVEAAVVVVRADGPGEPGSDGVSGDSRLVAYLVLAENAPPEVEAEARELARSRLPEYMVPAGFVRLAELPLTANGKVDRARLPAPGAAAVVRGEVVPPRGPVEEAIAAIWGEVLGVAEVGAEDNFFDLGGHSLLMVQVHERIRAAFPGQVTMLDLFRHPTVTSLAAFLEPGADAPPEPVAVEKGYSRAEQRRRSVRRRGQRDTGSDAEGGA